MNKSALKKSVGHSYRIRPIAKRFKGGPGGLSLPPVDDVWKYTRYDENGVWIENTATHHCTLLRWDQMYDYLSDNQLSQPSGFLNLKVQLNIGGDRLWIEPTFRPGQALPDQFADVRDWKRENDGAYIQSLWPLSSTLPSLGPAIQNPPSGLGVLLGICLGVGLGLLIANA
jgi:hypothetical protein